MEWKLSKFERSFFRVIVLLIFIPAVSYVVYKKLFNNEVDWGRFYKSIMEERYDGIVTNKYVDFSDHAIKKIVLDNEKTIGLIGNVWYARFDTGDYVIKEKGSLIIKLVKKNNKDTLYFNYRHIKIKE